MFIYSNRTSEGKLLFANVGINIKRGIKILYICRLETVLLVRKYSALKFAERLQTLEFENRAGKI